LRDFEPKVYETVYNKIVGRVLFEKKEHESLKIIPFVMWNCSNPEISKADVKTIKSFKCMNPYNELGRLLICLFDDSEGKDIAADLTQLSKKLDITYVSDCVASTVIALALSTRAAESAVTALYTEIKTRHIDAEGAEDAISNLERAMFEMSSYSVCAPIPRS
jgi:hypothetical protein